MTAEARMYLGACYTAAGRLAESEALLREALSARESLYGGESWPVAEARLYLADLLAAQGRTSEARAMRSASLALLESLRGREHPMTRHAKRI